MKCLFMVCMSFIIMFANKSFAVDISKGLQRELEKIDGVCYGKLDSALQNAEKIKNLTSLIIVKDGYIISENYYGKNKKETLQDVFSASKTVIGLLTGIAVKENYIRSVDDPMASYLKTLPSNWDTDKKTIQIRHLLSMTNGLSWNEDDYDGLFNSEDPLNYVLSKPLQSKPSELFNYDVSAFILSAILSQISETSSDSFVQKYLFDKLGISGTKWEMLGSYVVGFNGLSIRPEDMAKIGQFMLQNGFTGTDSLLPDNWMDEMSKNQVKNGIGSSADGMGDATDGGYGYTCWLARKDTVSFFWAGGFGGQRIIVVPEKQLVVVMTASIDKPFLRSPKRHWKKMDDQDRNLLNFFTNKILGCF